MSRIVSILATSILTAIFAVALAGCGENSSVTTITGSSTVKLATPPSGPNTTIITVDTGPSSAFLVGLVNVLYATVTVCAPGSSNCATIDHVLVDTGSIGLRVLASNVQALNLQPVTLAADLQYGTPAGDAYECYQFVIGGLWGPLVSADVKVGGETANSIPIQLIDNTANPLHPVTQDCITASNNTIQNSASTLGANGILGIGDFPYDCGLYCAQANYAGSFIQYYACPAAGGACAAAAVPTMPPQQTVNPVAYFQANSDGTVDNNGTIILLPATPALGAVTAEGRLVFGIGTQANNQIPAQMPQYFLNFDPLSADYLSFTTIYNTTTVFTNSVIDSGSNGLFFDDPSIPTNCQTPTGGGPQRWYCPPAVLTQTVEFSDGTTQGPITFSLASADALFGTPNSAFGTLGGSLALGTPTFVWGLSFFYGRAVYTSIYSQALPTSGPWVGIAGL